MRETNEFAIEWVVGDERCTVTAPERTRINSRILELKEKYPDQVEICNSELFHIPNSWIRINPNRETRELSEEEKEQLRERMAKARNKRLNK